jgi:hypothetical protein
MPLTRRGRLIVCKAILLTQPPYGLCCGAQARQDIKSMYDVSVKVPKTAIRNTFSTATKTWYAVDVARSADDAF